mgnify:CR=1 FL=1
MITTIRKPATKIRYRHECECGAILEFDKEDIVENKNIDGDKIYSFECPYCKESVIGLFNMNLLLEKFERIKVYGEPRW